MFVCDFMCAGACGEPLDSLELELQAVSGCLMWVLGTKLRCSATAAGTQLLRQCELAIVVHTFSPSTKQAEL